MLLEVEQAIKGYEKGGRSMPVHEFGIIDNINPNQNEFNYEPQ
ncbi:hypothetical protein [Metabacillus endolithicus]